MKYEERKQKSFFEGKSFYLIIALCLIAIGVAAWMALSKMNEAPDYKPTPNTVENSSSTESAPESFPEFIPPSDDVDGDASEPYVSEPEPSVPAEPPVANTFTLPLNGNIAKQYSQDKLIYSNTYKDMRVHLGIDIVGAAGSPVRSCGNGTVVAIIEDARLGKYVEIDHGRGIVARYCGLDQIYVEEGAEVDATVKLGTLAEVPEECVDAIHLHLEFLKDEAPIDPLSVIYPK